MGIALMTKTQKKKKPETRATAPSKRKHSQLGKAIIEALRDIKNGNFIVIKRENIERDTHKLFQ